MQLRAHQIHTVLRSYCRKLHLNDNQATLEQLSSKRIRDYAEKKRKLYIEAIALKFSARSRTETAAAPLVIYQSDVAIEFIYYTIDDNNQKIERRTALNRLSFNSGNNNK